MAIRRAIFGSALLLVSVALTSTFAAQAQEIYYDEIGWWSITYRRIANLSGCDAVTKFPDQTMLTMALIQIESTKEEWVFLVSNPRWDSWLGKEAQHELRLVTTKRWEASFSTTSDKKWLVLANAPIDFINSIGEARSLRIVDKNGHSLTRSPLDLKDSAAAIKAVLSCVRERSLASLSGEREAAFF
jgi:hypothetical protein